MIRRTPDQPAPCPLRADQLGLLDAVPGLIACVRDEQLGLAWCNRGYARQVLGTDSLPGHARGRTLGDLLPPAAAAEREQIQRDVLDTGRARAHYQLSGDRRVLSVVCPIDAASFGHRGIAALVGAATSSSLPADPSIPTLLTPALPDRLTRLSRRELEVLFLCGCGMSAPDIGRRLFRASKTIEHHIQSIHAKLGFQQRGELVRFCVERGLHLFSWDEWEAMTAHLASGQAGGEED